MARRLLLIDDDRLQPRVLRQLLEQFRGEKFELEWAPTYEEGLDRLMAGGISACLLDYELGERDGLQLLREAMLRGCPVPILFLTAESAESLELAVLNAGAVDFIVKSEVTPRSLERSLRYALRLADTLEAMRRLATHDELTGLANRRELDRILGEECERSRRFGQPVALVLVDVDHFKAVNDSRGHLAGDGVLREIALRLTREVRNVDRVARIGGDEFCAVLVNTEAGGAAAVAARLVEAVRHAPVTLPDGGTLAVTVSAGSALLPDDARDAAGLRAAADNALYAAKEQGRNRAVGFSAPAA